MRFSKTIIIIVIAVFSLSFPVNYSIAQEISLPELVELFIALEIIPQDKAEQARSVLPNRATSDVAQFDRNLSVGDRGEDVRNLQETLNLNSETRIALFGPGSPGNETTYFGTLTKQAVIRFQEFYFSEVLTPSGLSYGTGFVGVSTRKKLNKLAIAQSGGTGVKTTVTLGPAEQMFSGISQDVSVFGLTSSSDELFIAFPSNYSGPKLGEIMLTGGGFMKKNTVLFGEYKIKNIASLDGSTITFTVPDIPYGRYDVAISNSKGISNATSFVILDPSTTAPFISRLSPSSGKGRTQVTIHGSGFTFTGNRLYTGYGVIENISSSNGVTIMVSIRPPDIVGITDPTTLSLLSGTRSIGRNLITKESEPMTFYVENDNGLSNGVIYTYFYDENEF